MQWRQRLLVFTALIASAVAGTPVVSAHGGGSYFPSIHQWYALIPIVIGIAIVGLASYLRRSRDLEPVRALETALVGLTLAVIGVIGLVQLSPITTLTATKGELADGAWMQPTALMLGATVLMLSLFIGRLRWPSRPRYAFLGVFLGLWIAYPGIPNSYHPYQSLFGYLLFAAVPATALYILYRDCSDSVRMIFRNRVTRRFGGGVAILGALFFMFSSGMLTMLPDPNGINLPWSHPLIGTLPILNPLVTWPAVEFWFPGIPLGGYLSVGMVLLIGLVVGLLTVNGAFVAYQWQCRGKTGMSGATGAAALAAPNACCCCGPVISQIAVVALGPTAAMPIYWLFIDTGSPLGLLFFSLSIVLLLSNVVRFSAALNSTTSTLETETNDPNSPLSSS